MSVKEILRKSVVGAVGLVLAAACTGPFGLCGTEPSPAPAAGPGTGPVAPRGLPVQFVLTLSAVDLNSPGKCSAGGDVRVNFNASGGSINGEQVQAKLVTAPAGIPGDGTTQSATGTGSSVSFKFPLTTVTSGAQYGAEVVSVNGAPVQPQHAGPGGSAGCQG